MTDCTERQYPALGYGVADEGQNGIAKVGWR